MVQGFIAPLRSVILIILVFAALNWTIHKLTGTGHDHGKEDLEAYEHVKNLNSELQELKQLIQQQKGQAALPKQPAQVDRRVPCPEPVIDAAQREKMCAIDPHDAGAVLKRLKYWKGSRYSRQIDSSDKYLLFDIDCGGFNNIRMAFEYHIIWAWITHRTLVLPPVKGWYLLDVGPIQVLSADKKAVAPGGLSKFGDYFDMRAVRAAVPVISTRDWLHLGHIRPHVPTEFIDRDGFPEDGTRKKYFKWLGALPSVVKLEFNGLNEFLYWPNKTFVTSHNPDAVNEKFVDDRAGFDFKEEWRKSENLYHVSCRDPDYQDGRYRSLTQIAMAVAFADQELYLAMLALIRDNVHLVPQVFELASKGIAELGLFKYSSLHIRRNDLQYKHVFIAANKTLYNIKPLLLEREHLYLATDEFEPEFFRALKESHTISRIQDLKVFPEIPRKLLGMVEMVICAGGRTFFGTLASTFTAYIHRLRGYIGAPDSNLYWHNHQYGTDREANRRFRPPQTARTYMEEHDVTWELIAEE